jgi:ABC-type transport system involved in cytochrome bd biosynthesis fused ATPase/permease subunit
VVLDRGVLVEEGSPIDLIEKEGVFYEMISKSGKEFENEMRALAMKKRNK